MSRNQRPTPKGATPEPTPQTAAGTPEQEPSCRWDAGDAGCGSLIMGIGNRIADLETGEILEVRVNGGGARTDLEAWCRMTGHRLLVAEDGRYLIRRG